MATKRVRVGFAIEGAGLDTTKPGGLVLGYGSHYITSDREWVEALVELPQGVSTEVNPFTGEWSTSSFSLRVDASDRLAALLLSDQRKASLRLSLALTQAATSINLATSAGGALNGTVIWVDDEAILIGEHTSGGTYISCTRAFWGTSALAHDMGALVYQRLPGWSARLITLIEHDVDTSVETTRWRGIVRNVRMDGATIAIECEEYLAAITRAEVNRSPRDLAIGIAPRYEVRSGRATLRCAPISGYESAVRPARLGNTAVFLDVDGVIGETSAALMTGLGSILVGGSDWLFGALPDVDSEPLYQPYEGEIWEVLVIKPGNSSLDAGLDPAHPPTHPLVVALALLTSTGTGRNGAFDVLGGDWGLGLDLVDLPSWQAAIATSDHLAIDHLVLGAGGQPVNVLRVVQDTLLRPWGYYLARTAQGALSVKRLHLPTLADAQAADPPISPYPGTLALDRALTDQVQQITASVGGTPGTGDPVLVTIREPDRQIRAGLLGDVRRYELDLQTLSPTRLGNPRRAASQTLAAYAGLLALGLDTVPRLTVRVGDHTMTGGPAPDLGAWVRLSDLGPLQDAWLVSAEGERVSATDGADWIGLVVGCDWSLADHSYTLTLLALGWRVGVYVREVGPAAVVTSWNAGTKTLTVEPATFAGAPDDPSTFTAGDDVRLCAPTLESYAMAPVSVTATTSTTITLSAAPAVTPAAGDVIMCAYTNEFSNFARYPATARPYAALADSSLLELEEEDGSFSVPDIYGSSVAGGGG